MDTNTNNQLMHTFEKGMDTDTSDAWLESGKYRYARNLRYLTNNESNGGELHTINGAAKHEVKFIDVTDVDGEKEITDYTVLASDSVRNYGVFVIKDNTTSGWYIFTLAEYDNLALLVFGPCSTPIANNFTNKISIVGRYEDEDNIKVYIADGEHELMIVNINNSVIYKSINQIISNRSVVKPIKIDNIISGTLKPALVLYSYRLYSNHSIASSVSPLSETIKIYNNADNGTGIPYGKTSTRGVRLTIDTDSEGVYDKILIYRITYEVNGQNPTIDLIYDGEYRAPFTYDDTSNTSLSSLSFAEYKSIEGIHIIPKIIESKNDYLFASNIKYSYTDNFVNWDSRAYVAGSKYNNNYIKEVVSDNWINDLDTPANTISWRNIPLDATVINENWDLSTTYDSNFWGHCDETGTFYNYSGVGPNVEYELIIKQTVIDKDVLCDGIQIDPKNVCKSLRRGELYRYGIVLYDKNGIKSEVKWIADIRIPKEYIGYRTIVQDETAGVLSANNIGVRFRVKNLPQKCIGYEIVRCKITTNDRSIVCQGVVSAPLVPSLSVDLDNTNELCPSGFIMLCPTRYYNFDYPNPNTDDSHTSTYSSERTIVQSQKSALDYPLLFFSPEISYLEDDIKNILLSESNINIIPLQMLCPQVSTGGLGDGHRWDPDGFVGYEEFPYVYLNPSVKARVNGIDYDYYDPDLQYTRPLLLSLGTSMMFFYDEQRALTNHGITLQSNASVLKYTNASLLFDSNNIKFYSYEDGHYDQPPQNHAYWRDLNQRANGLTDTATARLGWTYLRDDRRAYKPLFYIKLYNRFDGYVEPDPSNITEYKITSVPDYNGFADNNDNTNLTFIDDKTSIGNYNFNYWAAPHYFKKSDSTELISHFKSTTSPSGPSTELLGIGGKCMIFTYLCEDYDKSIIGKYLDRLNYISDKSQIDYPEKYNWIFGTVVCNITKPVVPYGGLSYINKLNNQYISSGNVVIENLSDSTIDVFDGDCFILCFECLTLHNWYHPILKNHVNVSVVYSVPLETLIDLSVDYGDRYSRIKTSFGMKDVLPLELSLLQHKPTNFNSWSNLSKPMYQYNTAYSAASTVDSVFAASEELIEHNKYDCRTHYSDIKSKNEPIDSWTHFKPANFLDVNSKYGEITGLRLFNNQLVYWQINATGVFSVNERTVLQDVNDVNIVLGNGDVLQRYDYLTTVYGMKENQFSDTHSNYNLYWYDSNKNEILVYTQGGTPIPMSRVKYIYNYLNANRTTSLPTLAYDYKYNEVLFSIKQNSETNNIESLIYNEIILAFTSVYDVNFTNKIQFTTQLLFSKDNNIYVWDEGLGLLPSLHYVVNHNPVYNKVYDNVTFGGRFYNGDTKELDFTFETPLKQKGNIQLTNANITNVEYDYRFAIPRNNNSGWGDRLRGKTMRCNLHSNSTNLDFSLLYIITKFRISWS